MDWSAVIAVVGTLFGVGLGGIIGYETQKRLQKRQRELDLDEQQRQHKRNQLDELSKQFKSLAINASEINLLNSVGLEYSEQENRDFGHDTAKATVSLMSFPHKELLILFYCRHHSLIDINVVDLEDFNQKLQPIIQKLIDDTYDPNFSVKTSLSAEILGIDPDEYQKAVENLP